MNLLLKLEDIKLRWEDVGQQLISPDIMSDMKRYAQLNREYSNLTEIVEAYEELKKLHSNIDNNKKIVSEEKDEDFRNMAKAELDDMLRQVDPMEESIKLLLVPPDPMDFKNAIVEIRAGAGGDEASLFAGELFRMYSKYIETMGWKIDIIDQSDGTNGGYKEIIFEVIGKGKDKVYGIMKYESGVHRVQRVPQTESQGRVHTSAASVAVLPEAEEFDIDLKESDVRKDTCCSSGPGGQSVNTTYSAVRLTHIPTGIIVTCQDEKSQIKNYEKAMKVLRSRLYEIEHQKYLDEISAKRRTMVSTGDRSAKIRTYNYPQSRVTDHRIGLTLYDLSNILDGNVGALIDALQVAENAEKLKEGSLYE
ncbi:MAG: peptide chain release factor 1 [Bacteroidetes bacterium]|nr:peptide chain release factor 1 [Bacteroidota bacterium]